MTSQQARPTTVHHRRLSRRQVLGVGTTALAATVLAACGERSPDAPELGADASAARQRALSVTTSVAERAPSGAGVIPEPGEEREIPVAIQTSGGFVGYGVEPIFISARFSASAATERRYSFTQVDIPSSADSAWSYAGALQGVTGAPAQVVMFGRGDLANLVEHERLAPLDGFLSQDAEHDPNAYWPRALANGQVDGTQYALPVGLAPYVMVFNRDLARASGIEPPRPSAFDQSAFLAAAQAMQGRPEIAGRERSVGFVWDIDRTPTPGGDFISWPPLYVFLQAAVEQMSRPGQLAEALRDDRALETIRFMRELRAVHGIGAPAERAGQRIRMVYNEGKLGMFAQYLAGPNFAWLFASPSSPDQTILPFPDFGAGGNPVDAWGMIGMAADAPDVKVAFHAMRALESAMRPLASVPAFRVTADELRMIVPAFPPETAQMLVDLMQSARYLTLSRRERGILTNTIDAGLLLNDLTAQEALDDGIHRLDAASR